jgi:undecaprenyl-diphosphatase
MILAALIPTVVIGVIFEELFEDLFSNAVTLGFEFVITGIILWWMDSLGNRPGKSETDMTAVDAMWVGILQGVSILPALSRSGLTIAAGLWRGMDGTAAGRFSFLLAIPSILGATFVELDDLWESHGLLHQVPWSPLLIGTVAALLAGYVSVKGTLWLLQTARMRFFAIYVWGLAVFILWDQITVHRWFPPLLH